MTPRTDEELREGAAELLYGPGEVASYPSFGQGEPAEYLMWKTEGTKEYTLHMLPELDGNTAMACLDHPRIRNCEITTWRYNDSFWAEIARYEDGDLIRVSKESHGTRAGAVIAACITASRSH